MPYAEYSLEDLYGRFCSYYARLDADMREVVRQVPEENATSIPTCLSYAAEFQRVWRRIEGDPQSRDRWLKRLVGSGDLDEAATVRAILHRALARTDTRGEASRAGLPDAA